MINASYIIFNLYNKVLHITDKETLSHLNLVLDHIVNECLYCRCNLILSDSKACSHFRIRELFPLVLLLLAMSLISFNAL